LEEAHTAVPGPPGTSRRLYLTFAGAFVVVLALVAVTVLRQLAAPQPGVMVTGLPGVAASADTGSGTGRSELTPTRTQWYGTFDQGGQKTQFEAVIQSRAGSIQGTVREPAGQGRTTEATLSGAANGSSIAFQKRYPNGQVVAYTGTFVGDGSVAQGTWSVGAIRGTWTMSRVAGSSRLLESEPGSRVASTAEVTAYSDLQLRRGESAVSHAEKAIYAGANLQGMCVT
jgi:hypothetical protein